MLHDCIMQMHTDTILYSYSVLRTLQEEETPRESKSALITLGVFSIPIGTRFGGSSALTQQQQREDAT